MRRLLALVFPCLALATLAAVDARAHEIADPRVLVVVPARDTLELRVNEMTPVAESADLRRRFDGDRTGTLDDSEQSDLTSFLAIRATRNLAVEEAGTPLVLATKSRVLRNGSEPLDSAKPLSVDVVMETRPSATKDVTVVVKDTRGDDHVIRVAVLASGVTLQESSAGDLDAKRGLVTGVALDRAHALTLRYRRN